MNLEGENGERQDVGAEQTSVTPSGSSADGSCRRRYRPAAWINKPEPKEVAH
jgi:hypothetical protein